MSKNTVMLFILFLLFMATRAFTLEQTISDSLETENVEITNATVSPSISDSVLFLRDGHIILVPADTAAKYLGAGGLTPDDSAKFLSWDLTWRELSIPFILGLDDSLAKHADTISKYKDHSNLNNINSSSYYHLTEANHTTLTGAGNASSLHIHDDRYFTETELTNGTTDLHLDSVAIRVAYLSGVPASAMTDSVLILKNGVVSRIGWNDFRTGIDAEPTISFGYSNQYWRGDKTWQDLTVAVVTGLQDSLNLRATFSDIADSMDARIAGSDGRIAMFGATGNTIENSNIYQDDNNIGFGIAYPDEILHAETSNARIKFTNNTDNSQAMLGVSNANGGFATLYDASGNIDVQLRSYGDSFFKGGKLGVGTSSPDYLFHVNDASDTEDETLIYLEGNELYKWIGYSGWGLNIGTTGYSHCSIYLGPKGSSSGYLRSNVYFTYADATPTRYKRWYIRSGPSEGYIDGYANDGSTVNTHIDAMGDSYVFADMTAGDDLIATDDIWAGSTSRNNDGLIRITAADGYIAGFEAYGATQGTGYYYAGQSTTAGGGFFYNGDGSPAFAYGEIADPISFFRRHSGVDTVVFHYYANSNDLHFNGDFYTPTTWSISSDNNTFFSAFGNGNVEIMPDTGADLSFGAPWCDDIYINNATTFFPTTTCETKITAASSYLFAIESDSADINITANGIGNGLTVRRGGRVEVNDTLVPDKTNGMKVDTFFIGTLNGVSGTVEDTIWFQKIDHVVTMILPPTLNGTSNSTAFEITNVPSSICPSDVSYPIVCAFNGYDCIYNGGSYETGRMSCFIYPASFNKLVFYLDGSSSGWSSSSIKGVNRYVTLTYMLY